MSAILALDQGTTGSSAIVFDETGKIRGSADREIRQFYPASGHVEHDPMEILATTMAVGREALARAGIEARKLTAIGIATPVVQSTPPWFGRAARARRSASGSAPPVTRSSCATAPGS